MIPASLSGCFITVSFVSPESVVYAVSALTTTSTQYDDYVHPQSTSSSTGKQSTPAKTSPATTVNAASTARTLSSTPTVGSSANTLVKTTAPPASVVTSGTAI